MIGQDVNHLEEKYENGKERILLRPQNVVRGYECSGSTKLISGMLFFTGTKLTPSFVHEYE
jgi:hypothetical protein